MPAVDPIVLRHAVLMLAAVCLTFAMRRPDLLASMGLLIFALRIIGQRSAWQPRGFGAANTATVIRLVLTAALAFVPASRCTLLAPATLALFALDGIDGWLARKLRIASDFGAALDMEVDAYFVAMLCACLWTLDKGGAWIFLPAVLRYVHVITVATVRRETEPRNRLARYAFSVSVCSFAAAFLPFPRFATFAALLGTSILCASFGRSFWWMFLGADRAR